MQRGLVDHGAVDQGRAVTLVRQAETVEPVTTCGD
jgi:hypothetical protein